MLRRKVGSSALCWLTSVEWELICLTEIFFFAIRKQVVATRRFYMKDYTMFGLMVGLLVGAGVVLYTSLLKKKKRGGKNEYDERQEAIRGKCFKVAFFVAMILQLTVIFLANVTENPVFTDTMTGLLVLLLDCTVFIVMAIINDAYFTAVNRPAPLITCFSLMGVLNFIGFIRHLMAGDLFDSAGHMDTGFLNLGSSVFMFSIVIATIIKIIIDKKKAALADKDDAE